MTTRARIYAYLINNQGATLPEIKEALKDIASESVYHTLYRMCKRGDVYAKGLKGNQSYFPKTTFTPVEKKEFKKNKSLESFTTETLVNELRARGNIIYFREE